MYSDGLTGGAGADSILKSVPGTWDDEEGSGTNLIGSGLDSRVGRVREIGGENRIERAIRRYGSKWSVTLSPLSLRTLKIKKRIVSNSFQCRVIYQIQVLNETQTGLKFSFLNFFSSFAIFGGEVSLQEAGGIRWDTILYQICMMMTI